MNQDFKRIVEQVSRDKGLDKSVLIETMQEAISSAAKRKYGLNDNFEVTYDDEAGEFEVFRYHEVVEEVEDPQTQISLEEALKLDPESSVGDELGVKLDTKDFGRIAAQTAKQVIIQRMKDAERKLVYDEYKDRIGKIITGIILRVEKNDAIVVNLGRGEAILPASEQIPSEVYYHRGERLRALVIDVRLDSRGPQIVLSRTHPDFLAALFEAEVPEIAEGIVRILGVSREAGSRAKLAVTSTDSEIDPVGACVGLRGTRVQGVVQELKGEKIDIIPYSQDIAHYVASALAPAVVLRVVVDEENRALEVVVPDDQLSLAIGRKGQNVRLASRLVGWRIDVKNESKYQRALKEGYQSILRLPGLGENTADLLFEAGYGSAWDIVAVSPAQIGVIEGLSPEKAQQVWDAAKEYVENIALEDAEEAKREAMTKEFFASKSAAGQETGGTGPTVVPIERMTYKQRKAALAAATPDVASIVDDFEDQEEDEERDNFMDSQINPVPMGADGEPLPRLPKGAPAEEAPEEFMGEDDADEGDGEMEASDEDFRPSVDAPRAPQQEAFAAGAAPEDAPAGESTGDGENSGSFRERVINETLEELLSDDEAGDDED
ncbi:MAG: transcription termination factor NusA [Deltaproteobacteria bacterium]|jgi:N utilization substance protein A|nr:transcription termination factor NusA [Deltaproteobacteria bacterium]